MTGNNSAKAILLMIGAMFCFATVDTFIKLAAGSVKPSQVMFYLTLGSGILITLVALHEGSLKWSRDAVSPFLIARYFAEITALLGMMNALATVPLSTVGAIIQTVPLLVTLGAVLFLSERVSWRRWSAIFVGFVGVLLIIQPGAEGFSTSVFWAVFATFGLALRDLLTRRTPPGLSSATLAAYTMYAAIPFAALWNHYSGNSFNINGFENWLIMALISIAGTIGYLMLIGSVRNAEVSVVSPYRYSRLLFMLVFGITIFGEKPNALVLTGAFLIVISGIYIMWRERQLTTSNS